MKKVLIYIIILTFIALITIGGTYAIFTAAVATTDPIDTGTHQIKVIYDGDEAISGTIDLVRNKDEGFRRVISIAIDKENSVDTVGNLYIHIDEISEGFGCVALKWELYKIENGSESFVRNGTFDGYNSGEKIYMLQNLALTEDLQEFAVYIWLNGYEAGNEVRQAYLRGFIGAESGIVSGITSSDE